MSIPFEQMGAFQEALSAAEPTHVQADHIARSLMCSHSGGNGEKGGAAIGPTRRGKGSKIMAIPDRHGLPVACSIASASRQKRSSSKLPSSSASQEPSQNE
jgi:hypothetical protein